MARSTPWGSAQESISISRGVSFVSTASHGGIMVTRAAADKLLSEHAKKRGMHWSGYLCYEEDCDAAIVEYDSSELRSKAILMGVYGENRTEQHVKETAYKSLSFWNADYLLDAGVAPEPASYEEWKARKEADTLRANKDPDFIVVAYAESHSLLKGITCVGTADGSMHFVTKESYTPEGHKCINRLSKCIVIDSADIPSPEDRVLPYVMAETLNISNNWEADNATDSIRKFDLMMRSVMGSLAALTFEASNESYRDCYDRYKRRFQFVKELVSPAYAEANFFSAD